MATGTAVTDERDERMDGMDVKESHSSSSSGPAVEPAAEAGTTPAPVIKTWSSIKELHSRLRELGAPIHGTKDRRVSGTKEEGVGGGHRTGDTKGPPWSNSTF